MSKRYYIMTFLVLSVSVLLLGFSFAKESGTNSVSGLYEDITDGYRVIYSNNGISSNDKLEISLINKKEAKTTYALYLKEVNNLKYNEVYYSVDGNELKRLENGYIKLGSLSERGADGDHVIKTLEIKASEEYDFKVKVVELNENNLNDLIKISDSVYSDDEGNLRYYGEDVNNYVLYNNQKMRIVGNFGSKIKLISDNEGYGVYDSGVGNYLLVEDYIMAFNNDEVSIENATDYKNWLTTGVYWLDGSSIDEVYYVTSQNGILLGDRNNSKIRRYIYEIEGNTKITKGDGTFNNPYEVSYGS